MCPNEAGLKAFSSVRAAWLETVSFSDKVRVFRFYQLVRTIYPERK